MTDPESIVQLGVAPVRIDILSNLTGVSEFHSAWEKRIEASFGSIKAYYLSLEHLIREKKAGGRHQEKADLESLLKARRKRE